MVAKITPGFYSQKTRQVLHPNRKRYPFFAGRPMGLFLSQPVRLYQDIEEIRSFLKTCRYVSDQEQFGVRDHWMPPEDFERARQGDCDDFALWTWRQLLHLGYRARFVYGLSGRYGDGHAWVTAEIEGEWFLVEPLAARFGPTFPQLRVLHYKPYISVEASGKQIKFYEHLHPDVHISMGVVARLLPEAVAHFVRSWSLWFWAWTRWSGRKLKSMTSSAPPNSPRSS